MCSFRGAYGNRGNGTELRSFDVVPVVGLEPTRHRWQRILSPPRLPFQHTGMRDVLYNSFFENSSINCAFDASPDINEEFGKHGTAL